MQWKERKIGHAMVSRLIILLLLIQTLSWLRISLGLSPILYYACCVVMQDKNIIIVYYATWEAHTKYTHHWKHAYIYICIHTFLPRCMQCRRGLAMRILSVRLSVCLSVTRVHCDKTVERSVQIYIPYERTFILVFWEEEWLVGGATPSSFYRAACNADAV